MSEIRPLSAGDLPAVARLYRATLQRRSSPPPQALEDYFRALFLEGPFADPAIPSLVAVENGALQGFIGATAQPFSKGDRTFKAAIASSLMVEDHDANPILGVRLLKAFLSGAQDISLTETASGATLAIWRQLGGHMLDQHSLDWVRVLSPARFGLELLGGRLKGLRLLSPLAKAIDAKIVRRAEPGVHAQWIGLADDFKPAKPIAVEEITLAGAGPLVETLIQAQGYDIRPQWSPEAMAFLMADVAQKPQFGPVRACAVKTPGGQPLGMFITYTTDRGHARLLQLLARRGQEGLVADAMFADAAKRRAIAVEGRITPQVYPALIARRCYFMHRSASAVHGKDQALVDDFASGRGMFNGLVGEYCTRLWGGEFDDAAAAAQT